MYRQIFSPATGELRINIPPMWYGQEVEVIAFPLSDVQPATEADSADERRKERDALLNRFSFSTKNFKFNRDEANDYD